VECMNTVKEETSHSLASRGKFRRYPAYRESGIQWVGDIPRHWKTVRADRVLEPDKIQVTPSDLRNERVFLYSIPAIQETGDGAYETKETIRSSKILLRHERLLVSKLNPRKGVVLIGRPHDVPTLCSSEFVPLRARGINLRFAHYLYLAEATRQRVESQVQSATRSHQRARPADITKMWHAIPPRPEQIAIANFLESETARIDQLIDQKKRLIELLEEKRTALITRAVTKGLDPDVPMKDSGVEWLGEIPEHWKMSRLRHVTRMVTSGSRGWASHYAEKGSLFVRVGNLTKSQIRLDLTERQLVDPPSDSEAERSRVRAGDVLCSITADIGSIAVAHKGIGEAYVNQHVALIRPRQDLVAPQWLGYVYLSKPGRAELEVPVYGGTKAGLSLDDVKDVRVPVPPLGEQKAIATFLNEASENVSQTLKKLKSAISLLDEYRSALISAAVTGKIDLRDYAA